MDNVLSWVLAALTTTPARWRELTASLPLELLTRAPAAGEWSAVECLQHMVDIERVFQFRLNAFLEGRELLPAFDPDKEGSPPGTSSAQLAAEFSDLRAESLQQIAKVTEADLGRGSRHAELGPVTLNQLLHEWVAHDLNHTIQAERAVMQPFIKACGPWQVYFTDHVVAER